MIKLYFYPPKVPLNRDIVSNPYTTNFVESLSNFFDVLNKNSTAKISILDLYKFIFKMDVVVFNWIENIGNRKAGFFQFCLFIFALVILKSRKVKIVWILHNLHPHSGESKLSKYIKNLMFNHANLIITHSKEGLYYGKTKAKRTIVFLHHPSNQIIEDINKNKNKNEKIIYDILIWGSIEPYKGIEEFLAFCKETKLAYKIKIIGKCKNLNYLNKMNLYISEQVDFENRMVSFTELHNLIKCSRYVLFPYKSSSVSSSGALLDTLSLYGNVIGPNKGAFSDLKEKKLCFTFDNFDDIQVIINEDLKVSHNIVEEFNLENSWDTFCKNIYNILNK